MWVCDHCGSENSDVYAICTNCSKERYTPAQPPASPVQPPVRPVVFQADKPSIEKKPASLFGPDDRLSPLAGKLEMLGKVVFILFCLLAGVVLVLATGTLEGGLGAFLGLVLMIGYVLFWGILFKFLLSAAAVLVEASYRSMMRPSDYPEENDESL